MESRFSRSNVRSELKSIKQDLLHMVTFIDGVVNRITKLESSFDVSARKRQIPADIDSDAFSEDDHLFQPKLLKVEQQNNDNRGNNNNVNLNVSGRVKAEVIQKPFLANATKPVAVPRPSTSTNSFASSSSSSSSFSAAKPSGSGSKPDLSIGQLNRENNRVVVFTDGSCFNNGKPHAKGGIGVYFSDNSPLNVSAPLPGKQSNNRAELQAAVKALMIIRDKKLGPVQIRTDSGYVKQGITSWINKWKTNGWRTASGNEVKNVEDWQELDAIQSSLDVEWTWVEAHKGIHGNEMADKLANDGSNKNR